MKHPRLAMILSAAGVILTSAWWAGAGDLNPPPGPVAPTMKTLAEIEPRIAVNSVNTPGDANSLFHISQPGSYYLTGDVEGIPNMSGIRIDASDVTLDLNGFSLRGVPGAYSAIYVETTVSGLQVRNGRIVSWGSSGIDAALANRSQFTDLDVSNNEFYGIFVGNTATVERCTVEANYTTGITVGSDSRILYCISTHHDNGDGIDTGANCLVESTISNNNSESGFQGGTRNFFRSCAAWDNDEDGIVGFKSTIIDCIVVNNNYYGILGSENIVISCTVLETGIYGIFGADDYIANCLVVDNMDGISTSGRIINCTVANNVESGIDLVGPTVVRDNTVDGNGFYGIVAGAGSRLEGNQVKNSMFEGIAVYGAGSLIVRNSASGNGINYNIAADNRYGPIVDLTATGTPAVSGNSAAGTLITTNPWANFAY
jgi:parallel beta-helix repeat protein